MTSNNINYRTQSSFGECPQYLCVSYDGFPKLGPTAFNAL